ncbi:MAG: hypothetical protein U5Q16_07790 [Gammaproteobacteria bacterium]|nr:hypothetical protein [Gammaproteobacteria bacterium]
MAGIYLYDDERDLFTQAPTTADAAVFGGFFHEEDVLLETQSWAVFGQYEWDFTPQWTGVVGARYTDENRDFEQRSPVSFFNPPIAGRSQICPRTPGPVASAWNGGRGRGRWCTRNVSTGFKSGASRPATTHPTGPRCR